ncbi:MAG: electron transfer flavoprotein subunit alpha/FixB family protein [Thermodesulfobacteriota bacterium]
MSEIFVVVEHRLNEVRDITYEMLWKAGDLAQTHAHTVTAILIGHEVNPLAEQIADRADKVLVVDNERFKNFNANSYKEIISELIQEFNPILTLIGNTAWGMELAPCLAVKTGYPLATDCIDIAFQDGKLIAERQMYDGKIFSRISFSDSPGYLLTVRAGVFSTDPLSSRKAEIVSKDFPADQAPPQKEFVEYVETAAGEVDICQAEFLISVGRGIGEEENIALIKELAEACSGTLSCSRPIVDKNWLPKYLQVGTSGKSVTPKVYLAIGISGAFQHMAGVSGAGTVIAVNKDPKAPIFRTAHYGIVEDLFKVLPALKEKLQEVKKG